MIYTTEKELSKALKSQPLAHIYLLYGEDSYLVEQYAALLEKQALGKGDPTFNSDRFDGRKLDFDALYNSVMTLPMLADCRSILIDDPDIERFTAGELEKLQEVLEQVEDGTVLILAVKQAGFSVKKSAKCRKLQEQVERLGVVAQLGARTTTDLAKTVVKRLEQTGATISMEDAKYLVERTTGELSAVNCEADKLAACGAAGLPITRALIDRLVPATVEAEIFSLSKAILSRDYDRAMGILQGLLYLREPGVNILYTLSSAFIDLYRAKAAVFADAQAAQIAADFGYKGREFAVKNALRDSRKLSLGFLKGALEVLLEADQKLKSSRVGEDIILQQTVTQLFVLLKAG